MQSDYTAKDLRRFWGKVSKTNNPNDCWLWTAYTDVGGYGQFRLKGKMITSHRAAWLLTVGDIPAELLVCHKCDVRNCCNPAHLFLGTDKENTQDMIQKGRHPYYAPLLPHPGESNGNHRLTTAQILEIRQRHSEGESNVSLAKIFGVTRGHIWDIVTYVLWKK